MKVKNNQVRIIGGSYKRSVVNFPSIDGLRPTPDRVRETLFNWLGQDLTGHVVLDLFAGSGVLGFESVSRGAKSVTMVEYNTQIVQTLIANKQRLHFDSVNIIKQEALHFLKQSSTEPYSLVFLDPPFLVNCWDELWPLLLPQLKIGGFVYVEAPSMPQLPASFDVLRQGCAGQSKQWLLNVVE